MRDIEIRFEELRKDRNLKQKDIANILGIREDTYSKYERCINDISLENCNKLANFYKVSMDYLLGLSDNNRSVRQDIDLKLLCNRLLKLRKENDLTQSQLGSAVGFRQNTYANYETGAIIPTTFKIYYIAIYYKVFFDYLVGKADIKDIK